MNRLGVPAGPLLDSSWIHLAARLGFDVLTYKTVRSYPHPSHPLPNVVFVDLQENAEVLGPPIETLGVEPVEVDNLAITNSFGNPSKSWDYLEQDIAKARSYLLPGQILVSSVYEDFAETAALAKNAGAQAIEANFSCPNIDQAGGAIYQDPNQVEAITQSITSAISDTPLILKMGPFLERDHMKTVLVAAAKAGARAISGINTISRTVFKKGSTDPALGKTRPTSGICGSPIRNQGLRFVKTAKHIIDEEQLDLQLIGVGGITLPEHFDLYFEAGADVAETATGMMWDPHLGLKYLGVMHEQERAHRELIQNRLD